MGRRRKRLPWYAKRRPPKRKRRKKEAYFLDRLSEEDIRAGKKRRDEILSYEWRWYAALAGQRSKVLDDIRIALGLAARKGFESRGWQRVVKAKWMLDPLSMEGSVRGIGGRFNLGRRISSAKFPAFPALYIAERKDTALQEVLGQAAGAAGLTSWEMAMTSPESVLIAAFNCRLVSVLDLHEPDKLRGFIDVVKGFKIPKHVAQYAKVKRLRSPRLIKSVGVLVEALLHPDWRHNPMQYDVPSPSQLFGHLAYLSGIEGILYPSKMDGGSCLAVFPDNFKKSDSFVELAGGYPREVARKRLDAGSAGKSI